VLATLLAILHDVLDACNAPTPPPTRAPPGARRLRRLRRLRSHDVLGVLDPPDGSDRDDVLDVPDALDGFDGFDGIDVPDVLDVLDVLDEFDALEVLDGYDGFDVDEALAVLDAGAAHVDHLARRRLVATTPVACIAVSGATGRTPLPDSMLAPSRRSRRGRGRRWARCGRRALPYASAPPTRTMPSPSTTRAPTGRRSSGHAAPRLRRHPRVTSNRE